MTAGNATQPLTSLHINANSGKIKTVSSFDQCMAYALFNPGYGWLNMPCADTTKYSIVCELAGQGLSPTGKYKKTIVLFLILSAIFFCAESFLQIRKYES